MYIALEIGIGLGAFIAGYVYSNEIENIHIAFFTCAVLSVLAFLFLSYGLGYGRQLVHKYG